MSCVLVAPILRAQGIQDLPGTALAQGSGGIGHAFAIEPLVFPLWIALIGAVAAWIWERRTVSRLNRQSAALAASQQRLSHVLEASQDGFWDYDITTGHVERCGRWREMLGYAPSDDFSSEARFLAIVHPDDVTYVQGRLEAMRQPEHPTYARFEYRIRSRHGTWRWFLDRAKIVSRDARQHPLRIVGTGSDITDRRRTENELKRSEMLFRQSQEISGVGGWELDVAQRSLFWTHETFRIHDLDPSEPYPHVEQALGYYLPKHRAILRSAVEKALETGEPYDLELQLRTAKDRVLWVRTIGRTDRDASGRIVRLYGSFQDITARKEDEAAREEFQGKLLETQKLESLGVLAGGVAHDFNNLLTAVLANAQLCRLSTVPGSDLDSHLGAIEKASLRAADLCHQLLAYAGRNSLSRQKAELNDLVRETVQLLELSVGKQAQLELELSPKSPVIVADRAQMSQVMMNLVINASEALPPHGGVIRIRTGTTWLTEDMLSRAYIGQQLPPAQFAFMEVSDTGCGMSAETLARIFDPFFTTKFTGRGLGLAAVIGIVRAHEGGFFVESVPGEGSTFRMCLPLSDLATGVTPPFASAATTAPPVHWKGIHVLVVDDESSVRRVTADLLTREGCVVETAEDGIEAVETFHAHAGKFDLVILDLTMPGLDGVGALKQIRELASRTCVLLMSGYTDREPALAALLNDTTLFLRKPFTREQLMEKAAALLARDAAAISSK